MPVIPVSAGDPRLDAYRTLRDADLLRAGGLFIAEGRLVVRRLIEDARFITRSLLVSPAALTELEDLLGALPDLPVYVLPLEAFADVAGFHVHRGCLALAERGVERDWRELITKAGLFAVLEGVADADNLGSILRHAAAFDLSGVLLSPTCVDPFYRKAIRTSMGAALRVPVARLTPWPDALGVLRADGFTLAALALSPAAVPLREARATLERRPLALLLGNEGSGLSVAARGSADAELCIPMAPGTDSLNVAAAAAIGFYEASLAGRGMLPEPGRPGLLTGDSVG